MSNLAETIQTLKDCTKELDTVFSILDAKLTAQKRLLEDCCDSNGMRNEDCTDNDIKLITKVSRDILNDQSTMLSYTKKILSNVNRPPVGLMKEPYYKELISYYQKMMPQMSDILTRVNEQVLSLNPNIFHLFRRDYDV